MDKRVTIIIPTYNAGRFLSESVECALKQTWSALELIVVDDGSTDDSVAAVEQNTDPRLRVIRQPNAGKSVAMNRALEQATGDFYCILDADDRMHPDRVRRQAEALLAEPDLAAVFCGHELLMDGRAVAPRRRPKGREACRRDIEALRMPAHDPTGMYRLSMVGGLRYEPAFRIGQGYDYILRVGEQWPMKVLEDCLYSYRVVAGSATRASVERRQEAVRLVRTHAASRRGLTTKLIDLPKQSVSNRDRDNGLSVHFLESVTDLRRLGRRGQALRTAMACGKLHPLDIEYWKPMAACLLPHWLLAQFGRQPHG